jgi:CRP/FNR family cyclic AMP-dependent transcriptional regulator
MSVKQVLKGCAMFSSLSDAEIDKVAATSPAEKEFAAGSTIIKEGDCADQMLVLREGRVAIQMTLPEEDQQCRKITVDIAGVGDIIGWSAIVEPYVYSFTAVCLQDARTLSLNGSKLRALFGENPNLGFLVLNQLIKVVSSRLEETRRVLITERSV